MKKRILSMTLAVCLALLITVPAFGAMSLSNFDRVRTYRNRFSDISQSAWYYDSVRSVYEHGIMDGKSAGIFDPSGNLTIAEAIKIAALLHKGYHTGSMHFASDTPWHRPYVDYARQNGIPINAYRNLDALATRSDFAFLISSALPDEALTPINRIADGAIPDVWESYSYGQAVYKLYRAGVLAGADSSGTFYPGRTLTRAAAATLVMRAVDANTRVSLSLATELTGEQIYSKASPAVFFIEILDGDDTILKTGSGFFISESGLAITNYHVVIGATAARITTDAGDVYDVAGIYDYNWKMDAALIQIEGEGFPYLELADSARLQTGATVYALGSPLGLQASFSRGIVSQALREIDGVEFIQLDAAISSGSSGGALLDSTGRVVGVTSATMLGAQNINLAVPINFYAALSRDDFVQLTSILISTPSYDGYYPAPDFGAFFDVDRFQHEVTFTGHSFSYLLSNFPGDADDIIEEYKHLVEQNLFEPSGTSTRSGNTFELYYNSKYNVMIALGREEIDNQECFTISLS